jgi:hypothetical protein
MISNKYIEAFDIPLYADIPKAVWAALAISLVMRLEALDTDDMERIKVVLKEEWQALYANRVVPQKPQRLTGDQEDGIPF